jgi:DNA-binding transcriptional MerR regulator
MVVASPQSIRGYQIGQAAQRSGVTAVNIRFYEKEKLIPARGMGASSYRMYSDEDVHQLRFIRLLRSLDMSLDEVRTLLYLDLRKKTHCQTARDTLDAHIGHVHTRLQELRRLEKDLIALRQQCDGRAAQCHLIEALHARAGEPQAVLSKSKTRTHG